MSVSKWINANRVCSLSKYQEVIDILFPSKTQNRVWENDSFNHCVILSVCLILLHEARIFFWGGGGGGGGDLVI